MERHIFLVGMPGSGKSALGRRVAQKLQIPYLDTDVYLTETTGMNTAQLYTTFGEQPSATVKRAFCSSLSAPRRASSPPAAACACARKTAG